VSLWNQGQLQAACPVYLKDHSYGEYVFDWAWADAYHRHGLPYYPKAVIAIPFTPVPGPRLLARDHSSRVALLQAVLGWCDTQHVSSLHLLFTDPLDQRACAVLELLSRQTVQFHWYNRHAPGFPTTGGTAFVDFEDFLAHLQPQKRKKIRQERRKVSDAGVCFRVLQGDAITPQDWDFFYRCYAQTYHEHGNPPYLTRAFFTHIAQDQSQHWVLFMAERRTRSDLDETGTATPIAASLIALNAPPDPEGISPSSGQRVAYGRYWGALDRVDCLHFEACYYQPIAWCIAHGYHRFEGGAQGEHKMARALLPTSAYSAHWLAHPAFSDAVERHLQRETQGVQNYMADLQARIPLKLPHEVANTTQAKAML
jgi:predicted N-acyltransferase